MTRNELVITTLKMEGQRWKLYSKIDNYVNEGWDIQEYGELKKELHELNTHISSNIEIINNMRRGKHE